MTSTAKNYAGQNLRGRSFKGQDLSGADFSGADLSGVDFTDAILRGANFTKAETGVQKRWLTLQVITEFIMSIISGLFATYAGNWVSNFYNPFTSISRSIFSISIIVFVIAMMFFAIIWQGFTTKAFSTVVVTVALTLFLVGTINGFSSNLILTSRGGSMVGAIGIPGAVIMAGVGTVTMTMTVAMGWTLDGAMIVILGWVLALLLGVNSIGSINLISWNWTFVLTLALLSIYAASRALKGDAKFDLVMKFVAAATSVGGTSFRGADLTDADFTEANLKSSDFRNYRDKNTN